MTTESASALGGGYVGPAQVLLEQAGHAHRIDVEVTLRGVFQPIDGRYHWYGRVAHSEPLAAAVDSGGAVTLCTPRGRAAARLLDVDPWGRYRIAGTGRPPFTP